MSRLLRVAAAVLFLTVLLVKPTPVHASGGFDSCTYYGYYGYYVFTCSDDCQSIINDPNVSWGYPGCIVAYCYYDPNMETTVLWVQCF
jgi:hypothetical protein